MLPRRLFFLTVAIIIGTGILHTGYRVASPILYLPVIFFSFAAITGFCPGLFFWEKVCSLAQKK